MLWLAPRQPVAAGVEPCDPTAASATAVCCGMRSTHGSGGRERRLASQAAIGERRCGARALVEKDAANLKSPAEMAGAEVDRVPRQSRAAAAAPMEEGVVDLRCLRG
jgi:hypothetical protein